MQKEPIEATVSTFGNETKINFVIDGLGYAFICETDDLAELRHDKMGELVKKVTF